MLKVNWADASQRGLGPGIVQVNSLLALACPEAEARSNVLAPLGRVWQPAGQPSSSCDNDAALLGFFLRHPLLSTAAVEIQAQLSESRISPSDGTV